MASVAKHTKTKRIKQKQTNMNHFELWTNMNEQPKHPCGLRLSSFSLDGLVSRGPFREGLQLFKPRGSRQTASLAQAQLSSGWLCLSSRFDDFDTVVACSGM